MGRTDDRRWKHLAARPLGIVLLAVLVVGATGWAIDESSLRREAGSWGYTFAAFAFAVYAVPVMAVMMALVSSRQVMGTVVAGPVVRVAGWAATAIMAVVVVAMLVSWLWPQP